MANKYFLYSQQAQRQKTQRKDKSTKNVTYRYIAGYVRTCYETYWFYHINPVSFSVLDLMMLEMCDCRSINGPM